MERWNKGALLDKSISNEYKTAFKEWFVTNKFEIDEIANTKCELCPKSNLKYSFRIKNKINNKEMTLGSSCVAKFAAESGYIEVVDPYLGQHKVLEWSDEFRKTFKKYKKAYAVNKIISVLAETEKTEWTLKTIKILQLILNEIKISPKQVKTIFINVRNHIDYHSKLILIYALKGAVDLKQKRYQDQLKEIFRENWEELNDFVFESLTPSQQEVWSLTQKNSKPKSLAGERIDF